MNTSPPSPDLVGQLDRANSGARSVSVTAQDVEQIADDDVISQQFKVEVESTKWLGKLSE